MIISTKKLSCFTRPRDGTLIGNTTMSQGGPGSYVNDKILHIDQTPRLKPHHQIYFLPSRLGL